MANLNDKLYTKIGQIRMNTPFVALSGIYGQNYENIYEITRNKTFKSEYVGAVTTKSVTYLPREGNPEPRIVETRAGLLNSIGLHNAGIDSFLKNEIPELRSLEVPIIASVAGSSVGEYVKCSEILAKRDEIDGIELNVSCPNIETGGIEFGCSCDILERLVATVRKSVLNKTLIVKLTPNVTDIADIAQAAINGGADALSLINTLRGMTIDLDTQKPTLGNRIGGLSGISIHPVAVYMVYRCFTACCKKANIPIIGIGGVTNFEEALELILAGATGVGIGTALFRDTIVFENIVEKMLTYLNQHKIENTRALIGVSSS
jgi:dihydroorotate dehydrogenase (NAD+) catalytic subunit